MCCARPARPVVQLGEHLDRPWERLHRCDVFDDGVVSLALLAGRDVGCGFLASSPRGGLVVDVANAEGDIDIQQVLGQRLERVGIGRAVFDDVQRLEEAVDLPGVGGAAGTVGRAPLGLLDR